MTYCKNIVDVGPLYIIMSSKSFIEFYIYDKLFIYIYIYIY